MKLIKLTPQKNTAQAMVEFAIVLPILLVLLYGLLEAGRVLFMYSTVVTATRQASRYGASTGGTVPRFTDCDGIRLAANKVDYLNSFDHTTDDIQIFWDNGPEDPDAPTEICTPGTPSQDWPATNNTRIIVTIKGDFNPIVRLVPFAARTVANGNPIEATSARTILVSIPIVVPSPSGTGADTTEVILELVPHRLPPDGPPHSKVGEAVTANVRVDNKTGTSTPTGTINYTIRNTDTNTVVTTCSSPLVNGIATPPCVITFYDVGNFNVHAEYVPTDTTKFNGDSADQAHEVGYSGTTTQILSDYPDSSQPGQAVNIRVQVTSDFGTNPTGPIVVTTAAGTCTINLNTSDAGVGSCSVTYTSEGVTNITATYGGDSRHEPSLPSPQVTHTVASTPPTYAPTAIPPTIAPPTVGPTALPTPVSNCNTIRDSVGAISISGKKMTLNIPNTNGYPVTAGSIYVAWNYDTGHIGSNSNLKLLSVKIDSTIIWESATGIHQPNYTITSFSNPAVFPKNQNSQLIFTFDQTYTSPSGEQIQIQFSTPGCESFPVVVPVGSAPTLVPGACGPVNATISAPFTYDGAGTFCWQTTNLGNYINSWNLQSLTINGVDFTNTWSNTYPPLINGYWYVTYTSNVDWGHFETNN